MRALALTAEASEAASAIYTRRCAELGIENPLPERDYAELLHLAVLLSQRVIEGRKLRLNILVPSGDVDLARLAQKEKYCGVVHVPLSDVRSVDVIFDALEPYLLSAPDNSSLLVMQRLGPKPDFRFCLLYFGASLTSMSRQRCEPGSILALIQRSPTIRIEFGAVSVGVGLDWFLTLQQGELLEIPRFEKEIDAVLAVSGPFRVWLKQFQVELSKKSSTAPVSEIELVRIVGDALREIIATIAHSQHGSTLLFGTKSSLHDTTHYQPGALMLDLPLGEAVLKQFEATRLPDLDDKLAGDFAAAIIRAIVNLSQTDGAVVFDDNLTVIGSSTFMKVTESAAVAGGARRKSAQSFVRAHPGVVAVVISQDGYVSMCS